MFLTLSVLIANPKKIIYTVANPARGLLNREKGIKRESLAAHPSPQRCSFGENKIKQQTQGACNKANKNNRLPEGHHRDASTNA